MAFCVDYFDYRPTERHMLIIWQNKSRRKSHLPKLIEIDIEIGPFFLTLFLSILQRPVFSVAFSFC